MGGYGSGSNTRFAAKTSDYRKIDLSGFNRVRPGERTIGTLIWSRGGERRASIGYAVTTRALRVHYTVTSRGQDIRVDEEIPFGFTRQPFGGERRWFCCRSCGRLCRVLYGGAYFRCRQCYRAVYDG